MSHFEGRKELGVALQQTIDLASGDIAKLVAEIAAHDSGDLSATRLVAAVLEDYAFEIEWGIGGLPDAFLAQARNWNAEDMRKGLRHGHAAFIAPCDPEGPAEGATSVPLVAGATVAGGIGLAATLVKMRGTVSVIGVPSEADLPKVAATGVFESPDCAFAAFPSTTGYGFQHTINQSGERLAGMQISISFAGGSESGLRELHAAVGSIIDDLEEPDSITPTPTGFDLRARHATTIEDVAEQIEALARARAASDGKPVTVERSQLLVDMQPSRILARRIKTFAGWLKMRQDRIKKEPPGPPSYWSAVSHATPTALAGFPVTTLAPGEDDTHGQMCLAGKAMASAGLDVLGDMEFRGFAEAEFIRGLRDRGVQREPRRWLGVHPVIPRKDGGPQRINLPDVIVRGPGLPEPTLDDFIEDDEE